MPFEKSVGAVVFRREGKKIKYLLIKHPKSGIYRGHWDFPKGHVEKGENWQETLKREVEEETGITKLKIIPDFYTWVKYFYRAKGREKKERKEVGKGVNIFKIVTYYLAKTVQKRVKLSYEHKDYAWLEYEKALKQLTYKGAKKILRKVNQFLVAGSL